MIWTKRMGKNKVDSSAVPCGLQSLKGRELNARRDPGCYKQTLIEHCPPYNNNEDS